MIYANQVTLLFYKTSNADTQGENIAKFRVAFFSWLFRCFSQHPRKMLRQNPALTLSSRLFASQHLHLSKLCLWLKS